MSGLALACPEVTAHVTKSAESEKMDCILRMRGKREEEEEERRRQMGTRKVK